MNIIRILLDLPPRNFFFSNAQLVDFLIEGTIPCWKKKKKNHLTSSTFFILHRILRNVVIKYHLKSLLGSDSLSPSLNYIVISYQFARCSTKYFEVHLKTPRGETARDFAHIAPCVACPIIPKRSWDPPLSKFGTAPWAGIMLLCEYSCPLFAV